MKRRILSVLLCILAMTAIVFFAISCDNNEGNDDNGAADGEKCAVTYTDENGTVKTVTVEKGGSVTLEAALLFPTYRE